MIPCNKIFKYVFVMCVAYLYTVQAAPGDTLADNMGIVHLGYKLHTGWYIITSMFGFNIENEC